MLFDGLNRHRAKSEAEFKRWKKYDVNPLGKTSKVRTLHSPNEVMTRLQRRFMKNLRELKVDLSSASSVKGSSPVANVIRHRGNRYFYLTDLTGAFDAVDGKKLAQILESLDETVSLHEVEEFLTNFCLTSEGGLITGSPSSPDLFNIYCAALLDEPLRSYCDERGIMYSRYLDDLTFSSDEVIGTRKRERMREMIQAAGFRISHQKSRVLDLKKSPIEINGIGLEFGGRVYLPRWYVKKIRGLIRLVEKTEDRKLLHKLHGMIGLFHSSSDALQERTNLEKKLLNEYWRVKHALSPRRLRAVALRQASLDPSQSNIEDDLPF